MEASEQVVLQSILDGQKELAGSLATLSELEIRLSVLKRLIRSPLPIPPEASPSAPVAALTAPAQPDTTGAQGDEAPDSPAPESPGSTYGTLAPNVPDAPPSVPGTIGKRMPEKSTTA